MHVRDRTPVCTHFNALLGYYFHIPIIDQKQGWCCSTILAKVLMESGIFKKDLEFVNCFLPGNFDQKSFKLNFEEGMSFGPELKLTGILYRKLSHWQMAYNKLKSGVRRISMFDRGQTTYNQLKSRVRKISFFNGHH